MFGNFFSNLGNGNVSGLSIAGLVASALLIFGRFGWLGKIAGAVLGMMMIGNNANMSQVLGGGQQTRQSPQPLALQSDSRSEQAGLPVQVKAQIEQPQEEREVIHRGR